jgi:hypothetical protein
VDWLTEAKVFRKCAVSSIRAEVMSWNSERPYIYIYIYIEREREREREL